MSQNMLTSQQFASQAGISTSTVLKWLRSGKIQGHKQNGKWMISDDQLPLQNEPALTPPSPAGSNAPAAAGTETEHYSVEEFSALTYLTRFGVERFLKEGRLTGARDGSGKWQIDPANLEKDHIQHLRRK
jgi:Helix-turn-helix domain